MSMQLSVVMIFLSVVYLYNHVNLTNIHILIGLFQVLEILTFKQGQVHNLSCENEFYLHENEKSFPNQSLNT